MKKAVRKIVALVLLLVALSGCGQILSIDELYSLPQPQPEFLQLQELIYKQIEAGSEYAAPTVGSRRQTIQLRDLNGDGVPEALAFLRDQKLNPTICIYQNIEGEYSLVSTIKGEGASIGRIEYADLNGDGFEEIIVSWAMSTNLMVANAYSLKDWSSSLWFTENCTDFAVGNIDDDGRPEVVLLSFDEEGGAVKAFSADDEGEISKTSASVSTSLEKADRFRISAINGSTGEIPAVFVEGHYTESHEESSRTVYLSDIFVIKDSKLVNITLDPATRNSSAKRDYEVYAFNIDNDASLEIPFTEKAYEQTNVSAQYYIFDWFDYDESGQKSYAMSTYHSYIDGWYFDLPGEWREGFAVRRGSEQSGMRSMVLSQVDAGGAITDLLTIYSLTDENREYKAEQDGRFILLSNKTTIYAARFNSIPEDAVTDEQRDAMIGRFHLIYSEWNSGAI